MASICLFIKLLCVYTLFIASVQSHPFCDPNPCCNGGFCHPVDNLSIACTCAAGFTGKLCTQSINGCSIGTNTCHANANCTNISGSYKCACRTGYSGDGLTCLDNNECNIGTDTCHANADCTNTAGSHTCACKTGYSGDGFTCIANQHTYELTTTPARCENITIEKPCYCSAALPATAIKVIAEAVVELLIRLIKEKIERESKDLLKGCDITRLENAIRDATLRSETLNNKLKELMKQQEALQVTIECTNPPGNGKETVEELLERKQELWNLYDNVVTWRNALRKSRSDIENHKRALMDHLTECRKPGWWARTFGGKKRR